MFLRSTCVTWVFVVIFALCLSACTEEIGSDAAQTNSPASASVPQNPSSTDNQTGPITGMSQQGGGSSLGGAKNTATRIVGEAQQQSRDVAGEPAPDDDEDDQ